MVTLILFLVSFFIIYVIIRLVKTREIMRHWAAVYPHIVILILAWMALAMLVSIVTLLDLFEGARYSVANYLLALQTPWILLTAALIVVLVVLWSLIVSREQER
jgi:hypothetical protein